MSTAYGPRPAPNSETLLDGQQPYGYPRYVPAVKVQPTEEWANMKVAPLASLVLMAIAAISATGTSAALASNPEFTVLPSVKKFTSTGGVAVLRTATTTTSCQPIRRQVK